MTRLLTLGAVALTLVAAKDDPLRGYVPGKPVRCITTFAGTGPTVADDGSILYRETGNRIWRTRPVGTCPALRPFTTLIVRRFGSQLCRNDQFRVLEPASIIPSNTCRFDSFTPYTKAADPAEPR